MASKSVRKLCEKYLGNLTETPWCTILTHYTTDKERDITVFIPNNKITTGMELGEKLTFVLFRNGRITVCNYTKTSDGIRPTEGRRPSKKEINILLDTLKKPLLLIGNVIDQVHKIA